MQKRAIGKLATATALQSLIPHDKMPENLLFMVSL